MAITFDENGKWETTFDCQEWHQYSILDCDGIDRGGDYYSSPEGYGSSIISEANNPAGLGVRGFRVWKSSGGDNRGSGNLFITFPSRQQEVWVRWHERYENGFSWAGTGAGAIDVKSLYFRDGSNNPYLGFYSHNQWRINNQNVGDGSHLITSGGGWASIYTTPLSGRSNVSDGSWHCFEVYMKMDTASELGRAKLWVNGNLIGETNSINFSGGNATVRQGWYGFIFLGNQKNPGLTRSYYVDVDDMVIYNQTPPNTDSNGNPFIGPIGWENGAPNGSLSSPQGLMITIPEVQ